VAVDADLVIARLAAGQHGALSRRQLLDAGVAAHVVGYRLRAGLLVAVHPGVYRVASSPVTWHQRIMAATLAAGPGAVASHRAAAFLHGLDGVDPRPDVTVPRQRAPRSAGIVVHRLDVLTRSDVEVRDGIVRTRPPATLLGLAAVVAPQVLERAVDDALLRGLISCAQLERRLLAAGRQGRAGVAALAALLDARTGAPRWTQSEFERRLLALVVAAGLPTPVPQFEVVLPGGRRAYLDLAWPEVRLGVEAQSYRHHAGRVAWSRDQTRTAVLVSMGWRILPVTWEDLVRSPEAVVATLRRARAA
jgi:very-short-patch-repair endonuclease